MERNYVTVILCVIIHVEKMNQIPCNNYRSILQQNSILIITSPRCNTHRSFTVNKTLFSYYKKKMNCYGQRVAAFFTFPIRDGDLRGGALPADGGLGYHPWKTFRILYEIRCILMPPGGSYLYAAGPGTFVTLQKISNQVTPGVLY